MIDTSVFQAEWQILLDRFRQEFNGALAARYYESLSAVLSTDEFLSAVRKVFIEEDFFPSPLKIINAAKGNAKMEAYSAWDKVMDAARGGYGFVAELGEAGDRALKAIGGIGHVGRSDIYTQLPYLKKTFLEVYTGVHQAEVTGQAAQPAIAYEPEYLLEESDY